MTFETGRVCNREPHSLSLSKVLTGNVLMYAMVGLHNALTGMQSDVIIGLQLTGGW